MTLKKSNLRFSKYSGCGNDFILVDDRDGSFPLDKSSVVKRLCHRKTGIGADGVVLLQLSSMASARMVIINADGSEAEMCGNGLRCLGQFMLDLGFPKKKYSVETLSRLLTIDFPEEGQVRVDMGLPQEVCWDVALEGFSHPVHCMDTGVPHAVFFVKELESLPFESLGRAVRHHPRFLPRGTNVNGVTVLDPARSEIAIRTFERGVEAETLACGTGATAAAIASQRIMGLSSPISVVLASKEKLKIDCAFFGDSLTQVTMEGGADFIFSGEISFN